MNFYSVTILKKTNISQSLTLDFKNFQPKWDLFYSGLSLDADCKGGAGANSVQDSSIMAMASIFYSDSNHFKVRN
jgi:hypothetical protein